MRLMVSGSAALPVQRLERWREISGHVLLERYGMTEIGMALSNPLRGERRPGFVARRCPAWRCAWWTRQDGRCGMRGHAGGDRGAWGDGVSRVLAAAGRDGSGVPGRLVPHGDVAVVEHGTYRILGRSSVDIIKTGGYKVSALEVEEVLRNIRRSPSAPWWAWTIPSGGERICAAVERRGEAELTLAELQAWAKERLAPYKIPRALRSVPILPRNALGKVTKPRSRSSSR